MKEEREEAEKGAEINSWGQEGWKKKRQRDRRERRETEERKKREVREGKRKREGERKGGRESREVGKAHLLPVKLSYLSTNKL